MPETYEDAVEAAAFSSGFLKSAGYGPPQNRESSRHAEEMCHGKTTNTAKPRLRGLNMCWDQKMQPKYAAVAGSAVWLLLLL